MPFSQHKSLHNSQLFLSGLQPCRWDFCSDIPQVLQQLNPCGDIFGGPDWGDVAVAAEGCQRIWAVVAMGQEMASSENQAEWNVVTDLTWPLHREKNPEIALFLYLF